MRDWQEDLQGTMAPPRSLPTPPSSTDSIPNRSKLLPHRILRLVALSPNPVKGALYMMAASVCFAIMNLIIRLGSEELSAIQLTFFRAFFAFLFMLPWAVRMGIASLRTQHLRLHVSRSLISWLSMYLWFTAVAVLPLADAVALNFTAPLFVTVGAAIVLHEVVGIRRWTATAIGFLGTLVILRPGFVELNLHNALPILSAICVAATTMIIKTLSRYDAPGTIVLYMNLFLAPLALVPALFVWIWPSPQVWGLMISLGLLGAVSHVLLTRAYVHADASAVQPFDYTRLPFVALLGYLFFAEVPSGWIWLGGLMIAGAAIYTARREAAVVRTTGR